ERASLRACVFTVKRIACLNIHAVQNKIVTRQIVTMRQATQPSELIRIQPDDARIRHRALTEIKLVVRTEDDHVCVVVTWTRQVIKDHPEQLAVEIETTNARRMPAFGNIQTPAMKREPVHRCAQVLDQQLALRTQTPYATTQRRAAEWQSRLGHIHSSSVV